MNGAEVVDLLRRKAAAMAQAKPQEVAPPPAPEAPDTVEGLAALVEAQAREALERDDIGRDSVRWFIGFQGLAARLLAAHARAVRDGRGPVSPEAEARILEVVEKGMAAVERRIPDAVHEGAARVPRAIDRRATRWIAGAMVAMFFLGGAVFTAMGYGMSLRVDAGLEAAVAALKARPPPPGR